MGLWDQSLRVCHGLCDKAPQSVRRLAQQTGLSTSRVPRLTQAMERRDRPPESGAGHGHLPWLTRRGGHPLIITGQKISQNHR